MPAGTDAVDPLHARRVSAFSLNADNALRLTGFYVTAFGARHVARHNLRDTPLLHALGIHGGAERHTLELGGEVIEIWQFEQSGQPCPRPLSPYDTTFQHFALVVTDMDLALSQLQRAPGWTPISQGGPQHLPRRSGGVAAFKFQDSEGHPLELLAFPRAAIPAHWQGRTSQNIFLGIDHSAISVRDTAASVHFYESLGFEVTGQTLNHGAEQAHLDGVTDPQVEVTALSLGGSGPHLELLCYRTDARAPQTWLAGADGAATRVVLAMDGHDAADRLPMVIVDPDGHRLVVS